MSPSEQSSLLELVENGDSMYGRWNCKQENWGRKMTDAKRKQTTLGLDIGTNSVGWALIETSGSSNGRIVEMGSHVFPLAVEGDVENGKYETKNSTRRLKRLMRRQNDRRKRRLKRVRSILQEAGLLPNNSDLAQAILTIDRSYLAANGGSNIPKDVLAHVVPYALRRVALDYPLEPKQLGRALYHLAQRRGFLSNRKIQQDDNEGVVKGGISELRKEMERAGARTLGEYFSRLNLEERRIRGHYTHRSMFEEEFEKIWEVQRRFHPDLLTEELRKKLHNALFFQRPLKSQKDKIGKCPFEKKARRCPWYRTEAQRFRLLQTVNHLRVVAPDGSSEPLAAEQRQSLVELLEQHDEVTCAAARKHLGLKKGFKFSIETDGAKKLKGDRTTAAMKSIFGDRWERFSESERNAILHDWVSIEKEKTLKRRAREVWGLTDEQAEEFANLSLEPDYAGLSLKAIRRILPHLEKGLSYSEAIEKEYDAFSAAEEVLDRLPPVSLAMNDLRNPIVARSLTFVRRVVNAVVSRYGKPDCIRVELARDIKQPKKEKLRRTREITERTREREKIRAEIMKRYDSRMTDPSRDDILKVQLAEECGWICPYTGKSIGWEDLFGPHPAFDIEHIIPFSISLDDSFLNKTLCHHHENRHVKGNRSPWQAYHGDPEKYEEILGRVRHFKGRAAKEKLRRFELEDLSEFEDFTERHLNDTRYASKLAMEYLSLLYGGLYDAGGKRRIQAVAGPITAKVRRWYSMTGLLGAGEKTRDDHRHHAIDAVAIALTSPGAIELLSRASAQMKDPARLAFGERAEPWGNFIPELKSRLAAIRTVHHQSRKVRGQLHEDTLYSPQENGTVYAKKPLKNMNLGETERIVDGAVRAAVLQKLAKLGEKNPAKAFAKEENLPRLKNGHVVKSARFVARVKNATLIDAPPHQRAVVAGNNHHMEIVATLDELGNEVKWEGVVVSMLEAYERRRACLKAGKPVQVVQRDHGPGKRYKFTLHCGDFIEVDMPDGKREIFVVRVLAQTKEIASAPLNDARKKSDMQKAKAWLRLIPGSLKSRNARKVVLTPFGEVRSAND